MQQSQPLEKVNGQSSGSQQSKLKEEVNCRMTQVKMTLVDDASE